MNISSLFDSFHEYNQQLAVHNFKKSHIKLIPFKQAHHLIIPTNITNK